MARFMAIQTVPGITEAAFREKLAEARRWRPSGQTTILKVYCDLASGKLFSECEALDRSQFEDWMSQVGWSHDAIYQVDLIHQVGNIWRV